MTWRQLEKWAEEHEVYVGARSFMGTRHLAELRIPGVDEPWQFWADSMRAAKRALCRAMEKILNSKQ